MSDPPLLFDLLEVDHRNVLEKGREVGIAGALGLGREAAHGALDHGVLLHPLQGLLVDGVGGAGGGGGLLHDP